MKFESKFGVGEIVEYNVYKGDKTVCGTILINSELLKVRDVTFTIDGIASYLCEYPSTGFQKYFDECELIGDQDFDQELGRYYTQEELDEAERLKNEAMNCLIDDDIPF